MKILPYILCLALAAQDFSLAQEKKTEKTLPGSVKREYVCKINPDNVADIDDTWVETVTYKKRTANIRVLHRRLDRSYLLGHDADGDGFYEKVRIIQNGSKTDYDKLAGGMPASWLEFLDLMAQEELNKIKKTAIQKCRVKKSIL